MADRDGLHALIDELRSLPGREQSAVLRSLSAAERSRVAALLEGAGGSQRAGLAAVAAGPEHVLALSDWLEACLRDAALPPAEARRPMTAAGRAALLDAAREAAAAAAPATVPAADQGSGRSLLSAIGGLLMRGGR
ncbi:MAG TPA: hypothetical protein VGB08_10840 [Allosphingosinicella sp.]